MGLLDARNLSDVLVEASRNGSRHTHSVQSLFNAAKNPPADGDVWAFDAATKLWAPTSMTIDVLSDVVVTSPAANEVLRFDGADWVNYGTTFGTWSPSIVQGVTVLTIIRDARYFRLGRWYVCFYDLEISSAGVNQGTNGAVVQIALPFAARALGTGVIREVGGAYSNTPFGQLMVSAVIQASDEGNLRFIRRDQAVTNFFGADPSFQIANTHKIGGFAVVEAAS